MTWDNLIVATTFAEIIPEPSTYALTFGIVGLIGTIVYRRWRR